MTAFEITAVLGPIVGMITGIGAISLGIANRRHQIKYAPPKLRVIPKLAFPGRFDEMIVETYFNEGVRNALDHLKTYACIEIKNVGPNPQVIHEIGFIDITGIRIPLRKPEYVDPEQPFPMTIEPDNTVSAFFRVWPRDTSAIHSIAYAKTDCGDEFTGSSPIIRDFLQSQNKVNANASNPKGT